MKKTQSWFQNLKQRLFQSVVSGIIFVLTVVGLGALLVYAVVPWFTHINDDQQLTYDEWVEAVEHLFWKPSSAGGIKYEGNIEVGGVKVGSVTATCSTSNAGMLKYDSNNRCMSYCNGSSWTNVSCITYSWDTSSYGSCSASCGGGTQTRTVTCKGSDGTTVADSYCGTKPATSQSCNTQACVTYSWNTSSYGSCSATSPTVGSRWSCSGSCGGGAGTRTRSCSESIGTQTRTVTCRGSNGTTVADSYCSGTKPATSQSCSTSLCGTSSYPTSQSCTNTTSCGWWGGGGWCFIAGTTIRMADGSEKNIEEVQYWDQLLGADGSINTVKVRFRIDWENRPLYSINDSAHFVTNSHPFMTTQGWKAIDVSAAKKENPELEISTLQVGDLLITYDGSTEEIISLTEQEMAPLSTKVYNFKTDGNNTYYANGYLVHNALDKAAMAQEYAI